MAISRYMKAVLRAISYREPDEKIFYKVHRKLLSIVNRNYIRPFYKIWDHQIPRGDHQIPIRIYSPKVTGHYPVLLFFHGGGWVTGDINSYDRVCTNLARHTNCTVVSVDYRLAPEYRFPTAVEDCYAAAKEIFTHPHLLGVSSNQITLIGDSAGGNLAAAVSLLAAQRKEFFPKQQILIYPATYYDHTPSSPFPSIVENGTDYLLTSKRVQEYMELYMSCEEDLNNPLFAPLLADDLKGQPRTLVITAEFDPLRDEGEAYAKRLKEAGNEVYLHRVRDALHGYFSLGPHFRHVKQTYCYINQFIWEGKENEEGCKPQLEQA